MTKTIIIAEIGVNHNGCLITAKRLIDEAKRCGADYVKFQTFFSELLVTKIAKKSDYQKVDKNDNETQFEMLKELELSVLDFQEIYNYCKIKKIGFLSTGFDFKSLKFLEKFNMDMIKIPSGEITNFPMLVYFSKLKKPIILSTGMSTINEIGDALKVLISGNVKKKDITLLHCTSEYPAPINNVNLNVIKELKKKFKIDVGYSDHTNGYQVALCAVALGAKLVEKHFTLDRKQHGPDHASSIEPKEFKYMVKSIRNIEKALGSSLKKPSIEEEKNKFVVRKSIIAKINIKKGDFFSPENITTKRPGNGMSPMLWNKVIGKRSKREFEKDELIEL